MLRELSIKDFAIIDELTLELKPGLNVMTGETGAGKTIIVEALKLVLGGRASTEVIRAGSETASATAVFDADELPARAKQILTEAGIGCETELIVHRVVGREGKHRVSINGVPATAAVLRDVASQMVDIASQHEHQLLLDESRYYSVLDEFAAAEAKIRAYSGAHAEWSEACRELEKIESEARTVAERSEFIKFQLEELKAADVKQGEEQEIETELSRLKHAVLLEEKARNALDLLNGDAGSAIASLHGATAALEQCAKYEPRAAQWIESVERARIEAAEVARELDRYADGVGSKPEKAEELEERLHLIRRLVRKHGGSVDVVIAKRAELEMELSRIDNMDEIVENARTRLSAANSVRQKAASELSKARKKAALEMSGAVSAELKHVGMAKAEFAIKVETRLEQEWDETGPDRVEFLISPNVGEPLRGLARIASGGELSRFMLALKCAIVSRGAVFGTSVFDEVDSGIGGGIASVVGRKLRELSQSRQVVCITHLPQVAAFADSHVRISKRVKAGRTVTSLDGLDAGARVEEIARMLGGEKVTETTLAHAKEMLRESGK